MGDDINYSKAQTNDQLTSTCPLHNNQQENQIEISSHSNHKSRTGFGHLSMKIMNQEPDPAIQAYE